MPHRLWIALLLPLLLTGCQASNPQTLGDPDALRGLGPMPGITSGLRIPAEEQFLLGGNGNGVFAVDAFNEGTVEVELFALSPDGAMTPIVSIPPGVSARHRFAEGEAAVLVNRSTRQARLVVKAYGDVRLDMRYTPAQ